MLDGHDKTKIFLTTLLRRSQNTVRYVTTPHHVQCTRGKGKDTQLLTKPTQWRRVGDIKAQVHTFLFSTLTRCRWVISSILRPLNPAKSSVLPQHRGIGEADGQSGRVRRQKISAPAGNQNPGVPYTEARCLNILERAAKNKWQITGCRVG